jgi:hypothetical protein
MLRYAAVIGGQDAKNASPVRADRGPRRHQHQDAFGQDEA